MANGRLYLRKSFQLPELAGRIEYGNREGSYIVYAEGIYSGYRYVETRYEDKVLGRGNAGDFDYNAEVAFPFGYGESYTTFSLSDFKASRSGDDYKVSVKVTNTALWKAKSPYRFICRDRTPITINSTDRKARRGTRRIRKDEVARSQSKRDGGSARSRRIFQNIRRAE